MKLILASMKDLAAKNIADRLLERYDFEKSSSTPSSYVWKDVMMIKIEEESVGLRKLPADADEVIIASRHASESGRPSLTVHAPGYPDRRELAVASPLTSRAALLELMKVREEFGLPHQVSLEATHHGPVHFDVPVTFVEIGSLPEQWCDEKAGEAVARAVMEAAAAGGECRRAIAIGGIHYAPLHTQVVLKTDIGVGHLLPKYVRIDETLIKKAIARTSGKVDSLLLDRKGATSEQRNLCQEVSKKLGLQLLRAGNLISRKT
jgi:D-aminoacyl-tRNA deacylase